MATVARMRSRKFALVAAAAFALAAPWMTSIDPSRGSTFLTGNVAHADSGIVVTKARIGCLAIQTDGNLTEVVAKACNGKDACSYKAPTESAYKRDGVRARTRDACSQGMDIEYHCGSAATKVASVPGDAWNHPAAELACATPPPPARAVCPSGTFNTTQHHCDCPAGTVHNYHDVFKINADCRAPASRPTCAVDKEFYTPTDHGCECPGGTARVYTDEIGSLHAKCERVTAKPVTTAFDPAKNGWPFGNPGECSAPPYASGLGCCTGMSWTSLALFWAHVAPPANLDDMRSDPKLAAVINATQQRGVSSMLADWAVRWAAGKADFLGVSQAIDRGTPVPIGLFAPTGVDQLGNEHSVVAYGYWIIDNFHKQVLIYDVDQPKQYCSLANVMMKGNQERWTEYCDQGEMAAMECDPAKDSSCAVNPEGSYWVGFWNEEGYFSSWDPKAGH
jgi:hypothetical protein